MRVAGIVLLTIAAVLIVPPLGYASFLVLTDRDPYRLVVGICELAAAVGGCFASVGGMLLALAFQRRQP